ncbi:NAD(+) diphosphatase [Streptococcus equinus]|uniref:NAD(+) diphosphatase n=1 Tax=Streptococcus equinus TaxID=1335 RepID=UPI00237A405D|nr:NUDIX domain-containing protein [Streptococcus equinus]
MFYKTMTYCPECGHPLEKKFLEHEGDIPYCSQCESFRFPVFNTAISAILFNETHDKILLIKQYNMPQHILLAGYVSQGENAEATVAREINEELGLTVKSLTFNATKYYERSNSLMINFAVTVTGDVNPNYEIDDWDWFSIAEAKRVIKDGSLAEQFLLEFLAKI